MLKKMDIVFKIVGLSVVLLYKIILN
uniref:Uncharacterized protein n=1 Tax=Anguilla anguilla TaxID=7936 RepID=A0A0E9RY41_ANGAN